MGGWGTEGSWRISPIADQRYNVPMPLSSTPRPKMRDPPRPRHKRELRLGFAGRSDPPTPAGGAGGRGFESPYPAQTLAQERPAVPAGALARTGVYFVSAPTPPRGIRATAAPRVPHEARRSRKDVLVRRKLDGMRAVGQFETNCALARQGTHSEAPLPLDTAARLGRIQMSHYQNATAWGIARFLLAPGAEVGFAPPTFRPLHPCALTSPVSE